LVGSQSPQLVVVVEDQLLNHEIVTRYLFIPIQISLEHVLTLI
jgi:hypothetical protein